MKTFIQFLEESAKHPKKHDKDHYEPVELHFGSHSVGKKDKEYEPVELKFGKHSQKPLKEGVDLLTEAKVSDTHKKLKSHYKFDGDGIHASAIAHYTGIAGSRNLNQHLIKTNGIAKKHKSLIKHLDSALTKHKTPHAFEVHTGVGAKHPLHQHLNGKHKGPIKLVHHAYTSTSLEHKYTQYFAGEHTVLEKHKGKIPAAQHTHIHTITIKVPKGHHGAYVDHLSNNRGEKEFILPRDTKLHVHPKPSTKTTKHGSDVYYHHHTWTATIAK